MSFQEGFADFESIGYYRGGKKFVAFIKQNYRCATTINPVKPASSN